MVVVVPGITGSRLCSADGRVLWGDATRLFVPWDGAYSLALPIDGRDDGIRPCGPIREMRIGSYSKDVYGGLLGFLEGQRFDVRFFDYDWRKDNRDTARLLAAELRDLPRASRVTLICQSNATYICRYAAKYEMGSAPRVENLIMVGTANGGAIRILREMNLGRQYFRVIGRRMRPETLFTFRSLYQDLPVYTRAVVDIDLFDAENWKRYGWSIFDERASRRADRRPDLFGTRAQRETFAADALARAVRFHEALQSDPDVELPRYHSIQSVDFPTPSHAVLRGTLQFIDGRPGDLHATAESQAWLSPAEQRALASAPFYIAEKHFEMITTPEAHAQILRIVLNVIPSVHVIPSVSEGSGGRAARRMSHAPPPAQIPR